MTKKDKLKTTFKKGDVVELIPNSFDPEIENIDWANEDNEDLYPNYKYTVEEVFIGNWREEDPPYGTGTLKTSVRLQWVCLVHTESCGGSGYSIPAYRFKLAAAKTERKRSPRKKDGTLRENPEDFKPGDTVWLLDNYSRAKEKRLGVNEDWTKVRLSTESTLPGINEKFILREVDAPWVEVEGRQFNYLMYRFTKNDPNVKKVKTVAKIAKAKSAKAVKKIIKKSTKKLKVKSK